MLAAAIAIGLKAFLIGFTGAMAPGPFFTITITETIRRGRRSAALLLVGHAILELVFIAAFVFGLRRVLSDPTIVTAISAAGGAFLVWTGGSLLRDVIIGRARLDLTHATGRLRYGPVLDGVVTSLSNPYWTIWWVTIGATLVLEALAIGPLGLVLFYIGHEAADVTWYGAVIGAVSMSRGLLTDRLYRVILSVLAVAVAGLGLYYLAAALNALARAVS